MTAPQNFQQPQGGYNNNNGGGQHLSTNDLKPRLTVVIKGTVGYNRISSRVEGAELERYNERRRQANPRIKFDMAPHTMITIANPEVIPNQDANPDQQLAEQFVRESFYYSKRNEENQATFQSKMEQLPTVWERDPATGQFTQVNPVSDDLTAGQEVYVVVSTFESSRGNNGVGLNEIYVEGKASLGNARSRDLSAYGLVTNSAPVPTIGAAPTNAQTNAQSGYNAPQGQPQQNQQYNQQQAQPQQQQYNQQPQQNYTQQPQQDQQQYNQPGQYDQQQTQQQAPQYNQQQPQQQGGASDPSQVSPWPNAYGDQNGGITYQG